MNVEITGLTRRFGSVTAVAGVDLAYDAATGLVTTTAGGIYACAGVIAVEWA